MNMDNVWSVKPEVQLDLWPDLKVLELSKFLFRERFMPLNPDDDVLNGAKSDLANLNAQIKWIVNGKEISRTL